MNEARKKTTPSFFKRIQEKASWKEYYSYPLNVINQTLILRYLFVIAIVMYFSSLIICRFVIYSYTFIYIYIYIYYAYKESYTARWIKIVWGGVFCLLEIRGSISLSDFAIVRYDSVNRRIWRRQRQQTDRFLTLSIAFFSRPRM